MKKRILSVACAAALVVGFAPVVHADPGPHHGNNAFGLCTAHGSGSDKGKEKKREAPPFQALADEAEAADQTVEEWCAENAPHPGGRG